METLFITGAGPRGITGRLIKEYFEGKYNLLTPNSSELDLTNDESVCKYFDKHHIDYVIHCATFRPTSIHEGHFVDEELESNLRMYYALAAQAPRIKKMIYFGSGAEFDKSKDIIEVNENSFGKSIPKNKYGLGKYIMNSHARKSSNIYNFRLFGTINKYERPDKNVISNLCVKAIKNHPLILKKNCKFSFVDIEDLLPLLDYALSHELLYHDYNLTNGQSIYLSEIGSIISRITNIDNHICFEEDGLNREYTGKNDQVKSEFAIEFTDIEESIRKVYDYYKTISDIIDIDSIDKRWKNK